MRQLDLFASAPPPPAEWFPVDRRRAFISNVARILLERKGAKMHKRWRLELRRLECDMLAVGIRDHSVIEVEQRRFLQAVETEMRRQIFNRIISEQGGGAA